MTKRYNTHVYSSSASYLQLRRTRQLDLFDIILYINDCTFQTPKNENNDARLNVHIILRLTQRC